jgi:hypothetical protein
MSDFTLGPWERNEHVDWFVVSVNGHVIAKVYPDVDEVEANARLIAAAPEMYKVLSRINNGSMEYADWEEIRELVTRIKGKP